MIYPFRKIYGITKQNMELLETALVQGFFDQFPDQPADKIKSGKIPGVPSGSPKAKSLQKPSPNKSSPANGKGINKRKMKNTTKSVMKKTKLSGTYCRDKKILL